MSETQKLSSSATFTFDVRLLRECIRLSHSVLTSNVSGTVTVAVTVTGINPIGSAIQVANERQPDLSLISLYHSTLQLLSKNEQLILANEIISTSGIDVIIHRCLPILSHFLREDHQQLQQNSPAATHTVLLNSTGIHCDSSLSSSRPEARFLRRWFSFLSRLLFTIRILKIDPVHLDLSPLVSVGNTENRFVENQIITIEDNKAVFTSPPSISLSHFPSASFHFLRDRRVVLIGIGGGSDCIQASQIALLLHRNYSCSVNAVVSIRTFKPSSQGSSNTIATRRTIENHDGEVGGENASGVFRVKGNSTGSGRFLENIPIEHTDDDDEEEEEEKNEKKQEARVTIENGGEGNGEKEKDGKEGKEKKKLKVYLVIDSLDGKLTKQIEVAIADAGGADCIFAVDTGGDALFSTSSSSSSSSSSASTSSSGIIDSGGVRVTPDQDLRVLKALMELNSQNHHSTPTPTPTPFSVNEIQQMQMYSLEIALGVDSPSYAQVVLEAAGAQFIRLSCEEENQILKQYRAWDFDGHNDSRFGKTAFAWCAALRNESGIQCLPLPSHVVMDTKNGWNPFVMITEAMRGIFIMQLEKHWEAINQNLPAVAKDGGERF